MRVMFAIGSMGGGGAERQVIHYLRHLDRSRFTPLLYLTSRSGELLSDIPNDVPTFSFAERRAPPRLWIPGLVHRQQVADLATVMTEQQVDVLCAITFYLTLVAGDATRRRPTPWLAVEMADPRLDFDSQTQRFRGLKRWLLRRAYHRANRCVAVSVGVAAGLAQRYGLPMERIAILPNFIDLNVADQQATVKREPLSSKQFHIATVGRFHVQKGHVFLIEAVRRLVKEEGLSHLHLHLLGQGPLESEFREVVERDGLHDHVTFAGFVPNPFAYVKQCQLFCLPSLFEGLPLALLEAIACQVPVVATDCLSGPREILADGQFGELVPPSDPTALAVAIRRHVQMAAPNTERLAAARRHVEQNYSIPIGIKKLEQLLETCANQ